MPFPTADRWVLLMIDIDERGLWVSYEDARGVHRDPVTGGGGPASDWQLHGLPLPVMPSSAAISVPSDLAGLLQASMADLPLQRPGPHSTGPVPLPVFVSPPASLAALPWETWLEPLLAVDVNRIQLVRLARTDWTPRPPFRLPIRILACGLPCLQMLQTLRNDKWYAESAETQAYGLHIGFTDAAALERSLRAENHDILVADNESIRSVLTTVNRLDSSPDSVPRLLIYVDAVPNELFPASAMLPAGMSMLWIAVRPSDPPGIAAQALTEVVLGIVHDLPLHEAVRSARRAPSLISARSPLLISDPEGIHDLRLAAAFEEVQKEALVLDKDLTTGDFDRLLKKMPSPTSEFIRPRLLRADAMAGPIRDAMAEARGLKADFNRETFGLVPLARAEQALSRARVAREQLVGVLEPLAADTDTAKLIRERQERVIDVTLDAFDANTSVYRPVDRISTLSAGTPHRLNVTIGNQDEDRSLVVGEVVPIDTLLPDLIGQPGHTLEVAVFAKDFTLVSPSVKEVYLPRLGGSKPISFDLVTPSRVGPADLRIGIYHHNHLLQSFALQAQVAEKAQPSPSGERQVTVQMDFAATARFTNLDELDDRALSIGVNLDPGAGTHTLMLKRDGEAEAIRMTEGQLSTMVGGFRELLERATYDEGGNARFWVDPPEGTAPPEAFQWVLPELAEYGRRLYREFRANVTTAMREKLDGVRDRRGEGIQVTIYSENFAFPWSVLYDYPLPVRGKNTPTLPICMGAPLPGSGNGAATSPPRGCPHNPDRSVYCIEGFWGVRHRLEQLVKREKREDSRAYIVQPKERARVCLAIGLEGDIPAQRLSERLRAGLKDAMVELAPEDDLLDLLWDDARRPAVLIVLGHVQTKDVDGEPEGPRIIPFPRMKWTMAELPPDKWVHAGVIDEYLANRKPWGDHQPFTLVLLMGCSVAALQVGTLENLVKSLNHAGAAAVVGTECTAFSGLVGSFAREVITEMWSENTSLGEAIRRFSDRLMRASNPLGLVFTCYGNSDLTLLPRA